MTETNLDLITLRTRANRFRNELGVPLRAFARRVDLSESTVREYLSGRMNLAQKSAKKIEDFISKYGL